MKLIVNLFLIIFSFVIVSCGSRIVPNNRMVESDAFAYGRLKIYQVYDDRKMREISSKCYLSSDPSIDKSTFFEHGLLIIKPKLGNKIVIKEIHCGSDEFLNHLIVKNFDLVANLKDDKKINYFGDVDIFISKDHDDLYVIQCVGNGCGNYTPNKTFYYYPKKIVISNHQKETYDYLKTKFSEVNKNQFEIVYQPMKIIENNETKNIPESKKNMPF